MKNRGLLLVVAVFGVALGGCGPSTQNGDGGGAAGARAGGAGTGGIAGSSGGRGGDPSVGGTGGSGVAAAGQGGAAAGTGGAADASAGSSGAAGADGAAAGSGQGGAGGAVDGGGLAGAGGQGDVAGSAAGSGGAGAGGQAGATAGASGSAGVTGVQTNGLLARYFDASNTKLAERVEQMPASATVREHIMMAPFDGSAKVASITWDGWINTSRPQNLAFLGFGSGDARYTITVDDSLTATGSVALVSFKMTGWHKIHLGFVPSSAAGLINARPSVFFQTNTSIVPNPDELSATQPF